MEAESGISAVKMRGIKVIRAIVQKGSRLIGSTAAEVDFRDTYKSAIVAIKQGGKNISQSLSSVRFSVGDILVLQASDDSYLLVRPPDDFYKKDSASSRSSSSLVNLVTRRFSSQKNLAEDAVDANTPIYSTTAGARVEDDMDAGFYIEGDAQPADSESSDGRDPEHQVGDAQCFSMLQTTFVSHFKLRNVRLWALEGLRKKRGNLFGEISGWNLCPMRTRREMVRESFCPQWKSRQSLS